MAAEQDPVPSKLVYLRDRAPRPKTRSPRQERRAPSASIADLLGEAIWLGRALFIVAAGAVSYWLLVGAGAIHQTAATDPWRAFGSALLANGFLTCACAFAGVTLLRDAVRATVPVAAAAGALIVVTLDSLGNLLVNGDLSDVSLSVRSHVLASTGGLAVGVWALSYAIRLHRRDRQI